MTQEQKEFLSRARAHSCSLDYMGLETGRHRTEDVKSLLSIIDDQTKLLTNLKSDLEDLKTFMIEDSKYQSFEGSMVESMIKALE